MSRRAPFTIAVAGTFAVGLGVLVPRALGGEPVNGFVYPLATQTIGSERASRQAVSVDIEFRGEFLGWAMHDHRTGQIIGDNVDQTSSTESMIKTWLVADFLRRNPSPSADDLARAREAIRWSDDGAAQALYEDNGGNDSIQRMITTCGMVDTSVYDGWWSRTQMSPRDALKLASCLTDGTAAGQAWTPWLLNEMRHVEGTTAPQDQEATRGGGRWGIIDGVPAPVADEVALKNGWTSILADGNWHLNCLAFTDDWTISVMMRYPSQQGLQYGADICSGISRQLLS